MYNAIIDEGFRYQQRPPGKRNCRRTDGFAGKLKIGLALDLAAAQHNSFLVDLES